MPKLNPEDQARVDEYISAEGDERKPFKPGQLLMVIFLVLLVLTLASYLVAANHGMM